MHEQVFQATMAKPNLTCASPASDSFHWENQPDLFTTKTWKMTLLRPAPCGICRLIPHGFGMNSIFSCLDGKSYAVLQCDVGNTFFIAMPCKTDVSSTIFFSMSTLVVVFILKQDFFLTVSRLIGTKGMN
jgi:hypothetical protein